MLRMKVLDEEWVLAYSELAVILAEEYGDGPLEVVTDDQGNEEYSEKSLERLEPYYEEAENILYRIGFTRKEV